MKVNVPGPDAQNSAMPHHFEVAGRRWRRSDPAIPEPLRVELVRALMAARRAVQTALRAQRAGAESLARAAVHDAKLALGERGAPYWEQPDAAAQRVRAAATIRALLAQRGPDKTICPSDVARTIGGATWRAVMPLVREVAGELAERGELVVRQRGRSVEPKGARGPIRLALPDAQR